MDDAFQDPKRDGEGIILVHNGSNYWLLQGDDHIDGLLALDGSYPRPVRCMMFASSYDLSVYLASASLGDLWAIHPAIVRHLRTSEELIEVSPPPL